MFSRKDESEQTGAATGLEAGVASPAVSRNDAAARISTPVVTPTNTNARRGSEISARRLSEGAGASSERRLTVGKGLSLSGEISACDSLIVEGKVDAKLSDGKLLEITESGQFRGTVEIENADIAGRYDGQLTVHGRLTVRSTGRVSGMVCYGELEVVAGGQIIGETQVVGEGKAAAAPTGKGFKNAAKFTSLIEDEEDSTRRVVVAS